ncbi:NAD(P)-dependent alcohol dehydrogenase [Streptomyces cyaneochromogenes]|uniref:NAD(P)-dependent alcohol dehydrogenase n=1 Tax=Streptomyces cyaneochromogenes TaxID=2496836 RepID=A0A3Q9EP07_9ACTN|nr:NAD(P)-dependent alcohol dehydrogenase [Streptomyces cyaneochromogenes]AZQ32669.1 NAD(P)-dependent alcohol dehydrogenase [Streptomyces cyaneochromogenes]
MKAVVQDRYGSADTLEFADIDRPVPGAGEVLVRVHAASVNAYDWHFMRGDPLLGRGMMGLRRPRTRVRGRDFAGRVEAVGSGVTGLEPGDEVYGEADGAFAEYVCARDGEVGPKPANLTFEQAAAIPLAGNTALIGLRDVARVRKGQTVLVNGASGGVGTFAVQLGKAYGAEVTAVCSTRNLDLVRSLGADRVVDYTREDFTRGAERYDVVLDLVGNRSLGEFRRVLTPTGTLVLSGGGVYEGGSFVGPMGLFLKRRLVAPFARHQRLLEISALQSRANLAALRELAESGKIAPVVERTYPLSEAAEAIRYLEVEHARAKVVVTV